MFNIPDLPFPLAAISALGAILGVSLALSAPSDSAPGLPPVPQPVPILSMGYSDTGPDSGAGGLVLRVAVQIAPCWFLNSDDTLNARMIPSRVQAEAEGMEFGAPRIPKSWPVYSRALGGEALLWHHRIAIEFPVLKKPNAFRMTREWPRTRVTLRYQACDQATVYPPRTLEVEAYGGMSTRSRLAGEAPSPIPPQPYIYARYQEFTFLTGKWGGAELEVQVWPPLGWILVSDRPEAPALRPLSIAARADTLVFRERALREGASFYSAALGRRYRGYEGPISTGLRVDVAPARKRDKWHFALKPYPPAQVEVRYQLCGYAQCLQPRTATILADTAGLDEMRREVFPDVPTQIFKMQMHVP